MIPPSIPDKASKGEKRLYSILKDRLSDSFSVWYEPRIDDRYPDFIILSPDFGLLVIEVKGWS
ncbi:MAG: nuclease-related domain-containing protein, partial [Sphaerospermopsis kisseleviana]